VYVWYLTMCASMMMVNDLDPYF